MSKVQDWIACDLRYVAETKLQRLTDDELAELYFGIGKKHGLSITSVSADRAVMIDKLMTMKREIQLAHAAALVAAKAEAAPEAAKAVEAIFGPEAPVETEDGGAVPEMTPEEQAARKDREERAAAFIQLAAAAAPPEPPEPPEPPPADVEPGARPPSSVTVDTHHRLRVCSFNACKMRLGSANKAYAEAAGRGDADDAEEHEGTHKGAELAQKWLTLAAIMADFDVIVLQEVPGTEKVMNEKVETFAAMLDIATEEGLFWTAVSSQKSGKDGKMVGAGAEVHVCFVKSPVEFKDWNTLRKVGATELDYAPLQVRLHDPRFSDPADRDFVLTSVHLPPSKRIDARDSQIAALLRNYAALDTSEYRMQQPFKPSKGVKAAPTHLIAGDFNTYPGNEQYNMLGSGFLSKIPKDAATTSGHQNFDNVLVDTHANDRLLIGGGILQLKNPHNAAKGEVGLSDHYPVFVEVCEVQKTRGKQPATALPVVESELVAGEEEPQPEPPPPLGLEPVPEAPEVPEVPEVPPPPLAEAPMAIWDRASEEAKRSNPNYNQIKPEFTDDSEEDSEALTDDGLALDLPRVVHYAPEEEAVMAQVEQSVVERAATSPGEAPPAAAPSTEAPPSSPPPPPPPAPEAPPTTSAPEPELTLDQEIEAVLGPLGPLGPELEAPPEPSPELADELEASRLEWEDEDERAKDLPEAD